MPAPRLVACVGDSITQGQVSANYVKLLERTWGPAGLRFRNAGVNGDLAYNVAQRLDSVIARQPDSVIARQPDIVTLLVGTNDVNARFDDAWLARYRKNQGLPVDPTLAWYAEQVGLILGRLAAETDARVAVLTIPPLGEQLGSRMNQLVDTYNAALAPIAARCGATVLPLHDRLVRQLPRDRTAPPYEGDARMVITAAAQHLILRRSRDEVSRRNGLTLLTDHIHLNDTAASTVAEVIGSFLQEDG